jgi:ubiquinone/menaquinone biosynthesis C-methylase UbiE
LYSNAWVVRRTPPATLGTPAVGGRRPTRGEVPTIDAVSDHDDMVRRSFERQVPLFTGPDSPFAQRTPGPLTWIDPLDEAMLVLDVACGAGHAAEQVAPYVGAVGVDLTSALLKVGADRLRENNVRNVVLQEANAQRLPFVDDSFDIVCCRSSLHHFEDAIAAIAQMQRVCRSDGRVVLLDLVPPSPSVRDRFDHVHRLHDPSHVHSFLEPELAEALGGFERLAYADTSTLRMPVAIAMTDQSEGDDVYRLLDGELAGIQPPSGFAPAYEDGTLVVSFTICVVHASPPD